jgi:two-component system chemotaxis sensor kinase CheA
VDSASRAIKDFQGEAEEIIEKLNLDLVLLADCADSGECDPDLLNGIFRGAHSLKGLAGMFGFDDMTEVAHHLESMLDSLRLGRTPLGDRPVEILFEGLETMARLVQGKGEDEEFSLDLHPLVARIQALLKGGEETGADILSRHRIDPGILSVLTEYEEHRLVDNLKKKRNLLRIRADFSLASFDQDLAEVTDLVKRHGEVISTLPSAGDAPDRISFQLLLGTTKSAEEIAALTDRDGVTVDELGGTEKADQPAASVPSIPAAEPESKRLEPEGVGDGVAGEGGSLRSISRTVRVDIEKLDNLMNIVGELVLSKGAIAGICEQLKGDGLGERARELQKATRILERRLDELQKGVMEVRMVPVAQLFEKLSRIVRRVAGEHGKKVTLDIRGAKTELDKLIMESLADPLMHIIRNAIDHGIESASERLAAGKPEKGTICLWASQKGNHVVIEVRDDGRGVDPEKVRRKALEKGLISETAEPGREEIFDLLFVPGFSTRDEVSDLSGRGIGMDVVKTNIAELSGMIEVDSAVGEGTVITITLPITMAIIKALIVKACGRMYAIPIYSVMETLMVEPSSVRTVERREVIDLRQSTLPLLRLEDIFRLQESSRKNERFFVAVVGLADKRLGIVIDELIGQQDVVIKSLGNSLCFVKGIAGAADLGNQKTILVLDVSGLMGEVVWGDATVHV